MQTALRFVVALPALLFGLSGLGWIVDPVAAAASLGVTLPDGLARSTIIGDLGAFFLCLSAMIAIGVVTLQRSWLLASAMVLSTAACMRIVAWLVHGADFAGQFIAVEVAMAFLIFIAGNKITAPQV